MSRHGYGRRIATASLILGLTATPAFGQTTLEAYAVSDVLSNVSGGIKTGTTAMADAGLVVASDLAGILGAGGTFSAYLMWTNSSTFSERYVGDLQAVSSVDSGQATRLYEIWYEQNLGTEANLRVGLYDLNSEFDVIESSRLFANSSHGIGAEYGQSGEAGPSIFPLTSLAARLEWAVDESHTIRYALLDGVPGDPDDPSKTAIDLGDGDGVLHALEYKYRQQEGVHIGVGAWLYSADFELIEPLPNTSRDNGNSGIYGFVDVPVLSSDEGLKLNAFLRYGVADDRFNVFDSYIGAGALMTGFLPGRPDDQVGIAVASARTGNPWRRAAGSPVDSHETAIELTYSTQVNEWLRIQPDIQYVLNPGVDPSLENALVLGVRVEISLRSERD